MKDFKKNAQFPGFRKGTIPPFMLPKVKQFVILDCLEKTLSEAVKDEVTVCPTLFSQTLPSPCRTEPCGLYTSPNVRAKEIDRCRPAACWHVSVLELILCIQREGGRKACV